MVGCANGFEIGIQRRGGSGGGGGRDEVKPGIGEGDDAGGYGVDFHEGELGLYGRVGGVDGAAALRRREGSVIVCRENYQARRRVRRV